MGGGTTTSNTVTKQDNTPWGPAQAPLIDIYGQAQQAYGNTPKTSYSGSYIAPQSQSTILSQMMGQQLAQRSMGQGNQIASNGQSLFNTFMPQITGATARAANPGGNAEDFTKYISTVANDAGGQDKLSAALKAANDPILQNLQEKVIPQAKLNASGSGTYGGDASSILMAQNINDNYTRNAQNNASQLAYQDYANKLGLGASAANSYFDRQLQGASLLPGLAQAGTGINDAFTKSITDAYQANALPIDTMSQIGNAQDQYAQDTVKALYQQWLDQINAPWQGLEQYRGAISGYPTNSTGSSQGTSTGGGGLF